MVDLQWLVALVDVGMGMGVVAVAVDRVVVMVRGEGKAAMQLSQLQPVSELELQLCQVTVCLVPWLGLTSAKSGSVE